MAVGLACCGARPLHLWIADQVRNDVTMCSMEYAPLCGCCLEASMTVRGASMTGWGDGVGDFRFLALLGMTR